MIRHGNSGDSAGMGRVYCEAWKKAYRGIIPDAFLDSLTPENSAPPADRISPENCLVCELDGVIAGLVNFGPGRDEPDAEIRTIYILPEYWRQGIGAMLFRTALEELRQRGFDKVFVWVLSDNRRARGFYEQMGMVYSDERIKTIAGSELAESRYEMSL